MTFDIDTFSQELRKLADDYFNQQIDFAQYRIQRKILLDRLEIELNGFSQNHGQNDESSGNDDIVNKVLELIRRNTKEIISE